MAIKSSSAQDKTLNEDYDGQDGTAADSGSTAVVRTVSDTTSIGSTGNFVNQDVNGLLEGEAWNSSTITYSFPTAGPLYGTSATYSDPAPFNGFQVLSAAQQAVVMYALGLVASYTLLSFSQITETTTTHAMIRVSGSASPATSYTYYPGTATVSGDVWLGNVRNDNPTKGSYAFYSILHELGHSLGLKHGQDDDGTHGVLPDAHNSTSWSVMDYHSYIGGDLYYDNAAGSGNQTYMSDDIAALQYIYGANFSTNAGNTVYTWSPTTGEEFINGVGQGAASTNTIYESIWDGGGTDVYDLSNYTTDVSIDLRPGDWSTFATGQLADLDGAAPKMHLAPGNVVNADEYNGDPRSLIEDADGGSGNDMIIGNDANNVLRGGLGNDYLDGGAGVNTAVFSGTVAQYKLTTSDNTTYTITGPDGTDTLVNIELLQFDSTTIAIRNLLTPNFSITDTTTDAVTIDPGTTYVGPVAGLQYQFVDITPDNLNITASVPNAFIHSGPGMDGLTVASGNNILDGSTGSNFLIGSTGDDTFYMDDRNPTTPIFSTLVNFHSGDNATVWGVNASDFTVLKLDNQGATGATGLDLIFSAPGHIDTSFVVAGYSSADLTNGRLTMSYGRTGDLPGLPGSEYMTLHAT